MYISDIFNCFRAKNVSGKSILISSELDKLDRVLINKFLVTELDTV